MSSAPDINALANKFSVDMGWGEFNNKQIRSVFSFLYMAAEKCRDLDIVLDVSAGQCRYRPFFDHSQYLSIDNGVGDERWNYSHLDLLGDAMDLPIQSNSVDVVLNLTSLEHYPKPQDALHDVYRVLRPGGTLYLYVPFVAPEHQSPHDYFRYTRFGLAHLCKEAGLEVEFLMPTNGWAETMKHALGALVEYVSPLSAQQQMTKAVDALVPFLDAIEASPESAVAYGESSRLPQMPNCYLLTASKPGQSAPSPKHPDYASLLQQVAGCARCKGPLVHGPVLRCESCGVDYLRKNGTPLLG
jgi:SAM-dependent methyltransferase